MLVREGAPGIRTVCEVGGWRPPHHRGVAEERSEAMKRTRRHQGAAFKAPVVLAAATGAKPLAEWSEPFHVHPPQVTEWTQPLRARAVDVCGGATPTADTPDLQTRHAKIGPRAWENDCFEGALRKAGWRSATR